MEKNEQSYLASERLARLMGRYAVPCIISLLVGALYNIVDQIFIANADYLASYGNAANTVVFPLTVIALGVAVMLGDGCCAFVSISLGRGRREDATRSVGNAILLCILSGLLLTAVYLILADPILTAFGGRVNEATFALAQEYFFYITLGIPFYMLGQALNPIIRADGAPGFAMVATLTGAAINIVLDPILIFPLHMGMKGAAIATVIGQIATAALSCAYLLRARLLRLQLRDLRPSGAILRKTLSLGLCSLLAQISLVAAWPPSTT